MEIDFASFLYWIQSNIINQMKDITDKKSFLSNLKSADIYLDITHMRYK